MKIYEFIEELKKQNAEQFFREWLFGNSLQNIYEVEKYFEELFEDLRHVISNNRKLANTYKAENNSNQYYPNVVVCDNNDLGCYKFNSKELFFKLLFLIFNNILSLRFNLNCNEYFVSDNVTKVSIGNSKSWLCGGDYQIYKTYEYKRGDILEKDLKIFQFNTEFKDVTVLDILGIL